MFVVIQHGFRQHKQKVFIVNKPVNKYPLIVY